MKRGFSALNGNKGEWIDVVVREKPEADAQDLEFGFEEFKDGPDRLGWMVAALSPAPLPRPT